MKLSEYQTEAAKTDQVRGDDEKSKLVPLLGLAGEVGTLLSEYKKFLRDGTAHQRFDEQVAEELGDLLWYIANVATKFGLDLDLIAENNLRKTHWRWRQKQKDAQPQLFETGSPLYFDDGFPTSEQIPRTFSVTFSETFENQTRRLVLLRDGQQIGNSLTDNAHDDDGYRFHDVFHLSYAAMLGWSPISRKLLGVKRKSNPTFDEVEDGARAGIIEELIAHLVFTYARDHNFLDGVKSLDYHLLKTIHSLVADREVKIRSLAEWEQAIFAGYKIWRQVRENCGGTVELDLPRRQMIYIP